MTGNRKEELGCNAAANSRRGRSEGLRVVAPAAAACALRRLAGIMMLLLCCDAWFCRNKGIA